MNKNKRLTDFTETKEEAITNYINPYIVPQIRKRKLTTKVNQYILKGG